MATADRPNEKPKMGPKKATKQGHYTIEPRPFNYGEYEFLLRIIGEFPSSQVWVDGNGKTVTGKKAFVVCTDTAERAEFIDYLLNKLDLGTAQEELKQLFKQVTKGHPLREESNVRNVTFGDPD